MQSFKDFIRVKDRESKMFIRESIYELKHNAFYNTDYFNKKYLYEEDAPEETDAETKDTKDDADKQTTDNNQDNTLDKQDNADAIRKQLESIIEYVSPCFLYLGPERLTSMVDVINKKLTKDSKTETFILNDLKNASEEDQKIITHLKETYSKIENLSQEQDKKGLNTSLKIQNGAVTIINEGFVSAITKFFATIGKWINLLMGKFKEEKGKECDTDKIKSIWNADIEKVKPSMTDDEKRKLGVTWTKDVSAADVAIMKNDKTNFYKTMCLISLKYGPKSIEYIAEITKKMLADQKLKALNPSSDKKQDDSEDTKKDDKKETNESYRFSRFGRMRRLSRRFR